MFVGLSLFFSALSSYVLAGCTHMDGDGPSCGDNFVGNRLGMKLSLMKHRYNLRQRSALLGIHQLTLIHMLKRQSGTPVPGTPLASGYPCTIVLVVRQSDRAGSTEIPVPILLSS